MLKAIAFVVALGLFSAATTAHAYDDSFSHYYNTYIPQSAYEEEEVVAPDANVYAGEPKYRPQRGSYEYEKEVEYLYGRNVLGYAEEMMEQTGYGDENLPYGWSIKGSIN